MKKIPTLFTREPNGRRYVTREVHPPCKWVLEGEGRATRKFDGTCMMLDSDMQWWARRIVKPGKLAPATFVLADHDVTTGNHVGWVPVAESGFARYLPEALITSLPPGAAFVPGTYELCGPKVNGNPESLPAHILIPHGTCYLDDAPRDFDGLADYLDETDPSIEGIVWWHEDGRMAKLKAKDFPG